MKRLEIGVYLKPKDENMDDGVLYKVTNIVLKDNQLDRVYCQRYCAGTELVGGKIIMASDIDNWAVVNMIVPSAFRQEP